jgi:hypothetical protein
VIGVDASPDIASVKNEFSVDGAAMKLPRNNVSTSANAVHAGHPVTRVVCPALPEPTAGRLADYAAKQFVLHLMPAVVEHPPWLACNAACGTRRSTSVANQRTRNIPGCTARRPVTRRYVEEPGAQADGTAHRVSNGPGLHKSEYRKCAPLRGYVLVPDAEATPRHAQTWSRPRSLGCGIRFRSENCSEISSSRLAARLLGGLGSP